MSLLAAAATPENLMDYQLLILFAVVTGAAVIPFLSRRLDVPSAVLEIVYGIVLFNTAVTARPEWFRMLKDLGFIYLMFIAGMELDLRQLVRGHRFCWYLFLPLLSLTLMPLLFVLSGRSPYLGIAVSVLSAGIVIPILKEAMLLHTDWGRDVTGIVLTGEFLSIVLLAGIDVYHQHGPTLAGLLAAFKFIVLLALAALLLRMLYVLAWWNPERVERVMQSEDPVEEGIRAVVAVAFAGSLIAHWAGVEPILGSFLAGVVFSFVFKSRGRFEEKINAVGFGFFVPFFFIGVGAEFDVYLLTSASALLLAAFLTLAVLTGNLLRGLAVRIIGFTTAQSAGFSLLLSAPLSLMVVAGALGRRLNLLSPEEDGALLMTALFSGILYPYLFRARAARFIADTGNEDHADRSPQSSDSR
jgi:Kef-type K+ transport system membrane component KefB